MLGLTPAELRILRSLSTPERIQDLLDTLPINFEKHGETNRSPRRVLRDRTAHCMEGAMLAAAALLVQGKKPLLLDLRSEHGVDDHVVALFKRNGLWGAISKTNHATVRYRDPIYKTVRELALSYFHEYFNDQGKKILREYSRPFLLSTQAPTWVTAEEELFDLAYALDDIPHYPLVPKGTLVRKAGPTERKADRIREWRET